MSGERVERRLAAILAADVAGYSRLMGQDEAGTLRRLRAHRRELIDPKIAEHKGRIVKTTGDGILIEFPSVVEAIACAVAVQRGMADRNAATPEDQRIVFRVGVNLGDIIIAEDNDIHGDGVNVAARLEGIAEPGGICVSRVVRDQVRDRLDLAFEDMGEQSLKNIARPVRVYRVRLATAEKTPTVSPTESGSVLALPDKPSIAVLPFANMSTDPEQEFFADGIAEDIITALSRYPSLFVIARNSCFTYKGRAVDVKQVGRELGVRYVLEGSLRRSGNRIRVTAQLVEPVNMLPISDGSAFDQLKLLVDREGDDLAGPDWLGMLAAISIVKGQPFTPDAHSREILDLAAKTAYKTSRVIGFEEVVGGLSLMVYPDRHWTNPFADGTSAKPSGPLNLSWINTSSGELALNSRINYFTNYYSISPGMFSYTPGKGANYLIAFTDSEGTPLKGDSNYRLKLPPNIPAANFWSVTLYDAENSSGLVNGQPFPSLGSRDKPAKNADGSTDIYLGPKAPEGKAGNWLATVPHKGYFAIIRLYGPTEAAINKSWKPGDIEKTD